VEVDMQRGRYDSVALTAAVTGGDVLPSQSSGIPATPQAIAADAVKAAAAGATCVHLHARDHEGKPTGNGAIFKEIVESIRAERDIVINITTGGSLDMSAAERLAGMTEARPEIATLNVASMTIESFPDISRHPQVERGWEREVLAASGNNLFKNTLSMVRDFAAAMQENSVTPEVEAYDMGHIALTRFLLDEGTLEPPIRLQLVLGVMGGADSSLETLLAMKAAVERIVGLDDVVLGVASMGFPTQFRGAAAALSLGLDFRVGMEDNLRIERDQMARGNADPVEKARALAATLSRKIQTPAEMRASLGPWKISNLS
jgi:uncharacterized protein (DUF849 family)